MADKGNYHFATGPITGSASAQNLLSIENPSGSLLTLIIRRFEAHGVLSVASLTDAVYRASRTTSLPTGGTSQTPIPRGDTRSPPATAVVRTGPTASLIASLIWSTSSGVILAAAGGVFQVPPQVFDSTEEGVLLLAPGEALLITADANLTTWTHYVSLTWSETTR